MGKAMKERLKPWLPAMMWQFGRRLRRRVDPQYRFDRRFGVDTAGLINPGDLDIDIERAVDGGEYLATPPAMFRGIVRTIDIDKRTFVFVDLGSGKGAALLYASHFPFKRIIGVELSRRLHEVAERNIRAYRGRYATCPDIESICDDASRFVLPEEPTFLYLANPFKGQVLASVLENVHRSLQTHPREMIIVYYHPLSRHDEWDRCGFVTQVARAQQYSVYRS